MRRRLTSAITMGLGLAGCSTRAIPGGSEGGTGGETTAATADDDDGDISISGMPTTASASASVSVTVSTSASDDDAEGEAEAVTDPDDGDDDGNVYFDVGVEKADFGVVPIDCDVAEEPPITLGVECELVNDGQYDWVMICIAGDDGDCAQPNEVEVIEALTLCYDPKGREGCTGLYSSCGPIEHDDVCCYWGVTGQSCPGRPFMIDGEARIAALAHRSDWADPWARAGVVDEMLARAWSFDAQHEHAAIASFARFAMQLLAIAAPPRFVDAALRAACDEREHATLFFGLAQAHGHRAIGPGPLDTRDALDESRDSIAIVVATVREGCIAETISAMQLTAAHAGTTDPALRDALARVVAQELEHVELAWSFVAWAYARGDRSLRAAVEHAFATAWEHTPKGPGVDPRPADAPKWRAHGRLTHADREAIAISTLRTLVGPAAREMFARTRETTIPLTLA